MDTRDMRLGQIVELMDEICEMENLVEYYRGRILRKQIAIEELLTGRDVSQHSEDRPARPFRQSPSKPIKHKTTVRHFLYEVLPDLDGQPWDYQKAYELMCARHPEQKAKIRRGLYQLVRTMLDHKQLLRVPGGFSFPHHETTTETSQTAHQREGSAGGEVSPTCPSMAG